MNEYSFRDYLALHLHLRYWRNDVELWMNDFVVLLMKITYRPVVKLDVSSKIDNAGLGES